MNHPDLQKLSEVKHFVFDVDGVLTDGGVLITEKGDQLRRMNIKDGYALQYAVKKNYGIIVISGGDSEGVRKRLEKLGITDVHLAVKDKVALFNKICTDKSIDPANCLYMGDDIPDIQVMALCGVKSCPSDAVAEIQDMADIISTKEGGKGAVRELIEMTLTVQGQWQ